MNESQKIPCSVGILTLNRAHTLPACLESLRSFEDVYICDGNSTDGTQQIAQSFGARVTKQTESEEPNWRLKSFGESRTRCVNAALKEWYFRLDSDETLSAEAAEEIRSIVTDSKPAFLVYRIPRKYVIAGKVIDRAITYPNYEIRLFRREAIEGYAKATHEKVVVKPGVDVGTMRTPMYVPLPERYEDFWKKFESGLRFDKIEHANISLYSWVYGTAHVLFSLLRYSVRLVITRLQSGNKMPLRYEMARFKYQVLAWWLTTKCFFGYAK